MSGLRTLGFDSISFLKTRGIDAEMLRDPDATVPMNACVGLLAEAVRTTGDDNLGWHVAERGELGSFDVHFYARSRARRLALHSSVSVATNV